MKASACSDGLILRQRRPVLWRRVQILVRLVIRRLHRVELAETDFSGNPKANPIRWLM